LNELKIYQRKTENTFSWSKFVVRLSACSHVLHALLMLRAVYLRKLRRAAVELVCDFGSEEQAGLRLVAHSLPVRVRAVRDADVLVRAIIQVTDSWDNVKQFVWIAVLIMDGYQRYWGSNLYGYRYHVNPVTGHWKNHHSTVPDLWCLIVQLHSSSILK